MTEIANASARESGACDFGYIRAEDAVARRYVVEVPGRAMGAACTPEAAGRAHAVEADGAACRVSACAFEADTDPDRVQRRSPSNTGRMVTKTPDPCGDLTHH